MQHTRWNQSRQRKQERHSPSPGYGKPGSKWRRAGSVLGLGMAFGIGSLISAPAHAQTSLFTFEQPNFSGPGTPLPFIDIAPNLGDPTLRGTFLSPAAGPPLQIATTFLAAPFVGQILSDPGGGETLTISFNKPVTDLTLNFAYNAAPGTGFLRISSVAGTVDTVGLVNNTGLASGTVTLSNLPGVTTFTLAALVDGAPVTTHFDNFSVTVTVAPEPGAFVLMAFTGIPILGTMVRRQSQRRRLKM